MQVTPHGTLAKTGLDAPFDAPPCKRSRTKPPMDPKRPPHRSTSLQDVVLKFIEKNNRAIWAVIFAIALAVIYGMNAA